MHVPVLQKQVIQYLDPKPNENFIDATIGQAGHSLEILKRTKPRGKILGIDADPEQIRNIKNKILDIEIKNRLILENDSYVNLEDIIKKHNFKPINGILFDLGMSIWHLEDSGRGFSFQKDEPLNMRYDGKNQGELTAEYIINKWQRREIAAILRECGDERFSERIAKEIIKSRKNKKIETTFQLIEVIKKSIPAWYQKKRIHFATRTFQALRITVNDEFANIKKGLEHAIRSLEKGGRMVIISFHSSEDRIVKLFLKEKAKQGLIKIETKKPITPCFEEIKTNRRSRSAKLRAAILLK
ncbi:16S rRNA (cytosine(1402)-N(4))-methyltransferase RsmH [Candidatus Atribacteria bacterium MT.SAG.1]|nr:16S rRNA (cytosine(1402)-N(4))-methyltransferase RsmH [Candidatus Atribacteria bacterium MT.SAG.1]